MKRATNYWTITPAASAPFPNRLPHFPGYDSIIPQSSQG
jgi:hypothetical protein